MHLQTKNNMCNNLKLCRRQTNERTLQPAHAPHACMTCIHVWQCISMWHGYTHTLDVWTHLTTYKYDTHMSITLRYMISRCMQTTSTSWYLDIMIPAITCAKTNVMEQHYMQPMLHMHVHLHTHACIHACIHCVIHAVACLRGRDTQWCCDSMSDQDCI